MGGTIKKREEAARKFVEQANAALRVNSAKTRSNK